jgi:hypothetical protein
VKNKREKERKGSEKMAEFMKVCKVSIERIFGLADVYDDGERRARNFEKLTKATNLEEFKIYFKVIIFITVCWKYF